MIFSITSFTASRHTCFDNSKSLSAALDKAWFVNVIKKPPKCLRKLYTKSIRKARKNKYSL